MAFMQEKIGEAEGPTSRFRYGNSGGSQSWSREAPSGAASRRKKFEAGARMNGRSLPSCYDRSPVAASLRCLVKQSRHSRSDLRGHGESIVLHESGIVFPLAK